MKQSLQAIQILRALAAVGVVIAHSRYGSAARSTTDFFAWDHMMEAGVDLFFVISGFIMMLVSDPATGRETSSWVFLARRVQRIVPLYWFYTLLLAAGAIVFPSLLRFTTLTPDLVIKSLLFIPDFHPASGTIAPLLAVGWTLQYEAFFYLVFACVLPLGLAARAVAVALLFLALEVSARLAVPDGALAVFLSNPVIIEFVAGMAMYWLYRRGGVTRRAGLAVAVLALPCALWVVGSGAGSPLAEVVDHRWLRPICWGIPALLVFYAGLALLDVPGAVGRALVKLGDASYSLYLCHLFVAAAVGKAWAALGGGPSLAVGLLVVVPASIAVALLSHRYIERPLGAMVRPVVARSAG
jgi:exopolysaccharide production protein ExoZ